MGSLVVGVTSLQGDVSEHVAAFQRGARAARVAAKVLRVRRVEDLDAVDGLAIPGGESTTISRLLLDSGLHERIRERARSEGFPLLGTCAGAILLAKEGTQVAETDTKLLALMDMAVDRNAFGRQRESFEADVEVDGLGPVSAVFIRAPAVTRTWGACRGTASLEKIVVGAAQGNRWALCFHPELTPDTRIHEAFLRLCREWKRR